MINGNRMHQSSISSIIANGLSTYVNKVFLFFNLKENLKTSLYFVIMGYCVTIEEMFYLIHFRVRL